VPEGSHFSRMKYPFSSPSRRLGEGTDNPGVPFGASPNEVAWIFHHSLYLNRANPVASDAEDQAAGGSVGSIPPIFLLLGGEKCQPRKYLLSTPSAKSLAVFTGNADLGEGSGLEPLTNGMMKYLRPAPRIAPGKSGQRLFWAVALPTELPLPHFVAGSPL
jgi:hypothetical protein